MDITATLRKAAEQRQLSVYQIAKETGLNQSGLNQFFNGTKDDLRLSTVQVLCDYLGLADSTQSKQGTGSTRCARTASTW